MPHKINCQFPVRNLRDAVLAYIIADGCIEWDFIGNVYISGAFSVSKEDYKIILKELERQFTISISNQNQKLKEVQDKLIQHSK